MKDIKQELLTERGIQSGKKETNQPELEDKSEVELKDREKRREEKRREEKNYKRGCDAK